jgi:5'-3' exoribonuclease 1
LPRPFHKIMLDDNTPLKHLYPKNFKIDLEGKMNDYEGICILPFANVDVVKDVFNVVKSELNEEDLKRNQEGYIYEYLYNKTKEEIEMKFYKN